MPEDNESTRAFVAVDIGSDVRDALAVEIDDLRRHWPRIKWVLPSNIHLTLAFLGHVYPAHLEAAGWVMDAVAGDFRAHEVEVAGWGCFGSPRAPRVVWTGIPGGADMLVALQARLAEGLRQAAMRPEDQAFVPHLTVGRVRAAADAAGLGRWIAERAGARIGTMPVDALLLMSSELRPQGPVYRVLARAGLSGN